MAVDRCDHILARGALALLLGATVLPLTCRAERADPPDGAAMPATGFLQGARSFLAESTALLENALHDVRGKAHAGAPDWLLRRSGSDPFAGAADAMHSGASLVVQEDRPDGTDMLTLRYVSSGSGALQTYAGAGLQRAQYFDTSSDPGPALLNRSNLHGALGAAAEIGAQLRLSRQLLVAADVRWADLHDNASALRSDYGPVTADAVMLGVTVGYRFR